MTRQEAHEGPITWLLILGGLLHLIAWLPDVAGWISVIGWFVWFVVFVLVICDGWKEVR